MKEGKSVMQEIQDEVVQVVVFRLGNEEFATFIHQVQEIIRSLSITPLPKVPYFVEGIVNLRGNILPVISLRKKFDLEALDSSKDTRIIVVNIDGGMIGMIVDCVTEVLRISKSSIEGAPPLISSVDAECIHGVVNIGKRLIIILDLKRIAAKEERKALQTIA